MKTKQPARRRPRRASAQELERDAKQQLAYLDTYKPRPRKGTAEEDREALAQIAYLDQYKPRPPYPGWKLSKADIKKLDAIHYKHERETLPAMLWNEVLGHLRQGNLTAAHYLLTHPACLGRFVVANAPQPPASVQKQLARLGFASPQDLKARLEQGQAKQRGKVLLEVLQTLAGACCFGEMLALLPYARHALHHAGYNDEDCRQAVALARGAMLHLPPDYTPVADLISLRQRAAEIKAKPHRKPGKAKRNTKLEPF